MEQFPTDLMDCADGTEYHGPKHSDSCVREPALHSIVHVINKSVHVHLF